MVARRLFALGIGWTHSGLRSRVEPDRADDHDDFTAGLTTIFPTIRGCIEQKYPYSPGAVKVWEKVSSVSSAADLNFPSFSRTVCGVSSALVQVTVVPGATTKAGGVKLKLSIRTAAPLAAAGVAVSPADGASGRA